MIYFIIVAVSLMLYFILRILIELFKFLFDKKY